MIRENFPVSRNNQGRRDRSVQRSSLYVAQTVFENVKVLAIDQTFTTGPDSGAAIPGSTATFELSQADAELLQEAEGYGDLYLTLRGTNGSGYTGRSAAVVARDEAEAAPKSTVIELPENVMDVIVSNPNVVQAVVHTSRRTMLIGSNPGQTNVYFYSHDGRELLNVDIRVERDIGGLESLIKKNAPDSNVEVQVFNSNILLTGAVPNAASADKVEKLAVLCLYSTKLDQA